MAIITKQEIKFETKKLLNYFFDSITRKRELLALSLIAIYFVIFSILYPNIFLSGYNLTSLLLEISVPAIMVLGTAILFIAAEFDLSIGFNVMFSSMFVGTLICFGLPIPLAIIITLCVTATVGLIVGLLVAGAGVNSLIATFAAGLLYQGFSQFIFNMMIDYKNGDIAINHMPDNFTVLGKTQLIPNSNFQIPIIYALVICLVFVYLVNKTKFFRQYYYVGANIEAAKLSGINVKGLKVLGFVISAVLCSIGGIIFAARYGSCGVNVGVGMDFQVINAAVIGGVSFYGGTGTITGAIAGIVFMTCLNNGLRLTQAPSQVYNIIQGMVLLGALVLDAVFTKRKVVG